MKTRCINLRDHEVHGLLDGSITALWRPVRPQPIGRLFPRNGYWIEGAMTPEHRMFECPWGEPGGHLIGREAFRIIWSDAEDEPMLQYRDGNFVHPQNSHEHNRMADFSDDRLRTWRSSQTMPQWASRIRRELVSVECRQVRDLTAGRAKELGILPVPEGQYTANPLGPYYKLRYWIDEHHGRGSWESNQWGWFLQVKEVAA